MKNFVRFTLVTAFIALITATLVVVPVATKLSQAADDVLILDHDAKTIMTGTVTDLQDDTFVLLTGDKKVTVDLDKINVDDSADKLLSNGMRVSVEGKFDNSELEATRVIKVEDGTPAAAANADKKADQAEEIE